MKKDAYLATCSVFLACSMWMPTSMASTCKDLPTYAELKQALQEVIPIDTVDEKSATSFASAGLNGGTGAPEWLAMVDTSGIVCAVVHSLKEGVDVTTHLAVIHRPFAVQVASTANGFSRNGIGVSTANLYLHAANNPSGIDAEMNSGHMGVYNFGINPYGGASSTWGTPKDPFIGKRLGGAVFQAGGLPLFNKDKVKVGGLGVSGDFRCTDHVIAWKVREKLRDGAYTASNNPHGLSKNGTDQMMQDIDPVSGKSASGFGYPICLINNPTKDNDGGAIQYDK